MRTTAGRAIADIYPLTPMQDGMLFHALSAPGAPLYLQQYVLDLAGATADDLTAGTEALVARHDVLRTGFVWESVDRPVQVVFDTAPLPLSFVEPEPGPDEDMEAAVDAAVERTLEAHRAAPFDLRRPPLLRVAAIPAGPDGWRIVATHHHLVLDGWSVPILHGEWARLVEAHRTGADPGLGPARRFRDLVMWQRREAEHAGTDPWKAMLGDLTAPTPLGVDRVARVSPPAPESGSERVVLLREGVSARVDAAARRAGLPPSTIVHAAWGLLLARLHDGDDATFGVTLAGRPADLPDVDGRVGMFVNSLPLRVRCDASTPVRDWLHAVHANLSVVRDHAHASLAEVARTSAVPPGRPLYESVLAFQNYWRPGMDAHENGGVRLRVVRTHERTSVPVAVAVALPEQGLWVRLDADAGRIDRAAAHALAGHYADLVAAIADAPDTATLGDLLIPVPDRPADAPHVVDSGGRRVPDGVTGTLVVDGRPTGTTARVRANGGIEEMGVAGEPECAWVARSIAAHPSVAEAAVVGPVAWVVPAATPLTVDDMLVHLGRTVPPEIAPAEVEIVAVLPRDATGAVDRAALAGPGTAAEPAAGATRPAPLRERLAHVPEERRKAFLEALFREPERGPRARRPRGEGIASLAERQWLRAAREADLSAWRSYLDGAAAVGPRPEFVDPAAEGTGVLDLAVPALDGAAERWTAAVAAALARHARTDDVVVASVARPRLPASVDGVVGPFARALPIRVPIDGAATVSALRAAAGTGLELAATHPDVDADDLQALLGSEIPVAVAVHPGPVRVAAAHPGPPLAVDVWAQTLRVRYDLSLWHPHTVEAFAAYAVAVATADGGLRLDEISVPMDETVLAWGDGAAVRPPRLALDAAVATRAAERPNAVAVIGPDATLTYATLLSRADRVAGWLRDNGIGVEDRVAVCVPRGTPMVWAALGVLRAGAAYVPVDPHWPAERVAYVLRDSGVIAAVTVAAHRDTVADIPLVCTIDDGLPIGPVEAAEPVGGADRPGGASAAYVIYTSGSTGRPKGVLVPHSAVTGFVREIAREYGIDTTTRLLGFAGLTFDISVFDIWAALAAGATLVLADDEQRLSVDLLQRLLEDKGVTHAELPPALMPLLHPDRLPALGLVSVGGEAPAGALVDVWATGGREFWNGYGPTETTVAVTLMRCERPSGGRTPPIGRPMRGHRAYVVDERLRLVPPGVPGELCIAGNGLARGYLGRPGATGDRFVPDPYSGPGGSRMYRTGDLVRWTGDGVLEFLGRVDRQVKIRGFRVELGEVETVLAADPRVAAVVVEPRDEDGTRHLVAYLVPAPGAGLDLATVVEIAAPKLPDYMRPTRVVTLDRVPLTPHGKVDRRALAALPLPAPDAAGPATATAGATTADSTAADGATAEEREIATEILAPLLGVAGLGPEDNFFGLGGNSLQATQVTARVRDRYAVEVSLADFFVAPTARRLARLIADARQRRDTERADLRADAAAPAGAAPPAEVTGPIPLAFPQERMVWMDEREHGHPSHHAPLALRLTGPLDTAALRGALDRIVARHPPLRAVFGPDGQRFGPVEPVPFETVEANAADVPRMLRADAERPFDLAAGPLIRVRLYRVAPDEHVLSWNIHHIVTDGWSIGVMLTELFRGYNALRDGREPELAVLPAHYADFVRWQHEFVASPAYAREVDWWRARLSGVPSKTGLNSDNPRGVPFTIGWRNVRLDAAQAAAATETARKHGVTLYMTTLAAWSLALAADHDWETLTVVAPVAGRHHSEWEPLVGYFVNRVPIRVPLHAGLRLADLYDRLRTETAEAFAHQDVPFEHLLRELSLPPEAVTVNFSIQNAPSGTEGLDGLVIRPAPDDTGRDFTPIMELYSPVGTRFEASMMLRQRVDGLAGGLEYNAALFTAERAERWAERFGRVLLAGARDPSTRLDALRHELASAGSPPGGVR